MTTREQLEVHMVIDDLIVYFVSLANTFFLCTNMILEEMWAFYIHMPIFNVCSGFD